MGLWSCVADLAKQNSLDLKSIKECRPHVFGNAYKVNADQNHIPKRDLPDQEAEHKTARLTRCPAINAGLESLKSFPGGEVARKIVTNSNKEVGKSKNDDDQVQVPNSEALNGGTQGSNSKRLIDKARNNDEEYFESQTAPNHHYQKPEDVIRIFMMKGFIGGQLFNDLIVPLPGDMHSKKNKVIY